MTLGISILANLVTFPQTRCADIVTEVAEYLGITGQCGKMTTDQYVVGRVGCRFDNGRNEDILQCCRNSECSHTQYQNVFFTWHLASMLGTGLRDGRIFRLVVIVSGILFLSNVSLLSVYLPGGNHIQGTSTHGDDSIWDDGPSNVVDNRLTEFTRIAGGNDVSISLQPDRPSLALPLAVVVGLPKSGTTSVYEFFKCSGFKTSHYCCCGSNDTQYPCRASAAESSIQGEKVLQNQQHELDHVMSVQIQANLRDGRPLFTNLGDYDIHTQLDGETHYGRVPSNLRSDQSDKECIISYFLPQHYHLDELYDAAPGATWILNLRRPEDWAKSVMGWLDMAPRLLESDVCYHRKASPMLPSSPQNDTMQFLIGLYERHTKKVREFARNHPSLRIIEIDIMRSDVGSVLTAAFQDHDGVRPDCWSRHNSGPFFTVSTPK